MENMERRVFGLFNRLENAYPEERWLWIYTCLKRWYYYWYHTRMESLAVMDDEGLWHRVSELGQKFSAAIEHHIHRRYASMDEVQAAFREIELEISHIIETDGVQVLSRAD